MGDSYDDRNVTYIGPRALVVGIGLYCAGFMALIYGANWIGESFEAREPVAGSVSGPLSRAATVAPAVPRPLHSAVQAPPRAHAGTSALVCAPAPPCAVRPVRKPRLPARPATMPAAPLPAAPPVRRAPLRVVPAAPAAPNVPAVPHGQRREPLAAPVVRSTAPQAQAARTPGAPARQTPAALLVPFASASGLMSSGALDPRAGSHAPLMVGPTHGLGPNPAATPFGGTTDSHQR
jgi:hypothetical protein